MDRKYLFWTAVATVILLGTLYLADFQKVLSAISNADKIYLGVSMLIGVSVLFFRSRVWHSFFQNLELDITSKESFMLFSAGEFLNNITPLGQAGGQPFMAYIIKNNTEASYERSLATVISADFMTGFPLLAFGLISAVYFLFNGSHSSIITQVGIFTIFVLIIGGGFVYTLWFKAGKIEAMILKIAERILPREKWAKKIEKMLEKVESTFHTIGKEPRKLVKPSLYANISFFADVLVLYVALISLGVVINPLYLFLAFPIANISKSAPTSGGSGVYELVLASVLVALLGIDFSTAVASAFIYRFSTYWVAIFIGYFSMSKLNRPGKV